MADAQAGIRQRFEALSPLLDEQLLRRFVAAEAIAAGYGGVSLVSRITNFAVARSIAALTKSTRTAMQATGVFAGGRRTKIEISNDQAARRSESSGGAGNAGRSDAAFAVDIESLRHLSAALKKMGHVVSKTVVRDLLRSLGYSLQANAKTREDAQFNDINTEVKAFQRAAIR